MEPVPTVSGTANLLDILDRVLDKGPVITGDVRIAPANVELLTIRIRLRVCSVDKAEEIGLNWWKLGPNLTHPAGLPAAPSQRLPRAVPSPRRANNGRAGDLGLNAELRAPAAPAKTVRSRRVRREGRRKPRNENRQEDLRWR